MCLDAAQLAPHRTIDISALDVVWVALSGHKLYAPFGAGALVGRRDWLDAAEPYLSGGGAAEHVDTDSVRWTSGPDRHEGGSPNVVGAVAPAAACATLRTHADTIAYHEAALATRLRKRLAAIDGVRLLSLFSPTHDRVGTVTFVVDGVPAGLVSAYLSAEHGIGVRDGRFCAHQLTDALLDGAPDHCAVRASLGLRTTSEHVERLASALARLVTAGPELRYCTDDGWAAEDDTRTLPPPPW